LLFYDKLQKAISKQNSLLCIGLDPDPAHLDGKDVASFLKSIISATHDLVCAYKPNLAFFEAMGPEGLNILKDVRDAIPPEIPVIGDAKRGDIGNTAEKYADALFNFYGFDAITANPYLGKDALDPFLEYRENGVFVLCRTTNPGASDIQELSVNGTPLYQIIAQKAQNDWNTNSNIGLVAGATHPDDIEHLRRICPDMPFLVPGIGAQEGDLEKATKASLNVEKSMAVINVSRGVLYVDKTAKFADSARTVSEKYREQINVARSM
jgi:orotidine-5'-phosphate decarboxylase